MGTKEDFLNSVNNEECYSIIRNRDMLNAEYHSTGGVVVSSYGESSDDYYGVASDSDMIIKSRYKNDPKLRKRCAVVLTHNEQVLQYERKRDEMYNEILQKQRRKLELRALEKQREKERRRLGRGQEKKQTKFDNRATTTTPRTRSLNEFSMSSESECETKFELRTRKPRQQHFKELEPLNIHIEMSAVTTTLLSQIESHLDKPTSENIKKLRAKEQTKNNDINKQTCDAKIDKSPTKMRELNLLADIAQHLSPYQLDLPEYNNIPQTPSPAPEPITITMPTPIPPPPPPASNTPGDKEVPKEKITITEQLIIQSLDNLLEKRKPQLDNNDEEQQSSTSYAHEPKLNTAAKYNSSPSANSLQTQNQQSNTQLESNDNNMRHGSVGKEIDHNTKSDETLEQILEESISVLKSVTSPYNHANDCISIEQQIRNNSTTPLLISNVESINQFEQTDVVAKQKSGDKENLNLQDTQNKNSGTFASAENEIYNKETYEKSQGFMEENRGKDESTDVLSSNILNCSESSVMCAADVSNIPNESEISRNLKVSSLMLADLSDISLESEISKHLPEIAEPSPVVTDMSDNSNESDNNTTNLTHSINEIPAPDLPFVMTNISHTTTPSTSQALETSFNQFNSSLNTPTKLSVGNSTNDLNTPLKFVVQPNLESTNIPLKNTLEPESDNNVTKFLDLILNKTVTDAESETRDKIIKELNALTADTTEVSETAENISNNEVTLESTLNEEATNKRVVTEVKTLENETLIEENANDVNQGLNKSHQTLEYSSKRHTQNNSTNIETGEVKCSLNGQNDSQTISSNNELNPPKENRKEANTQLLSDISALPSNPSSPSTEIKSLTTKQTFNIRCRVRLKRLNIDEHNRINNNESCVVIPIIKPIELLSSKNDTTKCDNVSTKTLSIKKPCLKHNNKHANKVIHDKVSETLVDEVTTLADGVPIKKPKLEIENSLPIDTTLSLSSSQQLSTEMALMQHSQTSASAPEPAPAPAPAPLICNNTSSTKSKAKPLKTVTFDLSNLNEELRDSMTSNSKQKSKSHTAGIAAGALGCYLKSSRPSRKLPDNTLRAAETLQLFVNTINESLRTPPATEFNKKRSPIKNKCIAEDETPRPPPAATLMGTPPCKKTCIEKSRSQITTTKCKDQLVSSLGTPSISSITSDITTARIYTSSPLDQTLPEYDDNVDTVADSELILPTTSGSLRRKLKRPKKSVSRPEPADDVSTDDISNHPECNGEDDTDAVVDNEDDVFAEELLPIPAANEHILEEIVSARPSHIGTGTVIRDDYMNIEATATVPVYLFNDESRDLGSPEPIQSSDTTSVVDSSSYLKSSSATAATNNTVAALPPSAPTVMGNLEKSMLSPSEHEVSSTQETFYQTPTKNKQTEIFGEKSGTSKEKGNSSSGSMTCNTLKQKPDDNSFKSKEEYQTSSNICLLQNNQVDTTNHSPEMCSLALAATAPVTTNLTSNRKIRKASTHDEILFNELQQQQLPTNKRKSHTTFCVESTSDNKHNAIGKNEIVQNNMDDIKSNGSLAKADDKLKKILKEVCKKDKIQTSNDLNVGLTCASNIGGGGSSPSTTTTINEEKLSKSKRKKLKSSKSNKNKSHSERSSKIVLKASKLTPHMPANPLIITIPKSRLLKPPSPPKTPIESNDEQKQSAFLDILHSKLFIEKDTKDTIPPAPAASTQNINQHNNTLQYHSMSKSELINESGAVISTSKNSQSFGNISNELVKPFEMVDCDVAEDIRNTNSTSESKEKSSSGSTTKRKEKVKTFNSTSSSIPTAIQSKDNNLIFVKDKYDLIKSKDKHHHHSNHLDQQDNKEKSRDKISSQSKSPARSRLSELLCSSKEKVKGEKSKLKHNKDIQKLIVNHQADNNLKYNISQSNNKFLNSALSTPMTSSSTPMTSSSCTTNNTKQGHRKSSKNNSSSSSSSSSLSYPAILKSKTNLTTAHSATVTAPAGVVSSQITTATPSTNNVRKKLKTK